MDVVFLLEHIAGQGTLNEDVKTIGIFSSDEKAQSAIERLKVVDGFSAFPEAFIVSRKRLDQISWEEGFVW